MIHHIYYRSPSEIRLIKDMPEKPVHPGSSTKSLIDMYAKLVTKYEVLLAAAKASSLEITEGRLHILTFLNNFNPQSDTIYLVDLPGRFEEKIVFGNWPQDKCLHYLEQPGEHPSILPSSQKITKGLAIEQQERQDESQDELWISVEERLPEDYERVLLWDTRTPTVEVGYLVSSQTKTPDYITHWQPLPEPPTLTRKPKKP